MTPEQLQAFGDCGEAQMPLDETCLIAGCAQEDFLASPEAQAAYRAGQLLTKLRIRQAVIKMAKDGVPSMVKIYLERYDDETLGEVLEGDGEDGSEDGA